MIESISAIPLAPHNMSRAVRFYRMLGLDRLWWSPQRLRAFGLEPTISISSPNLPSGFGPGRDVLSFTIPTLTPSMRAWSRLATVQTRHRATPNGASGSST